jgi:hypothetical protein
MPQLPVIIKMVSEMKLQAFNYAAFLTRFIAADGKHQEPEPLAIPKKSLEAVENMAREFLISSNQDFQSYRDFKIDFPGTAGPQPPGALFGGPTPKSLQWEYKCLHQWLDALYWQLYGTATPETMKEPQQPIYNVSIRDVSGIVNVNSHFDNAIQTLNKAPGILPDNKKELLRLMDELRTILASAPSTNAAESEIVAEQAEAIASEAARPTPRKKSLEIKASGLLDAAKALEGILPTAFSVAKRIAEFVTHSF